MKIEIQADVDNKANPVPFILTDEDLDNDNFVEIIIADKERVLRSSVTLSIDELFSALIAFDSKRSRRLSREEKEV